MPNQHPLTDKICRDLVGHPWCDDGYVTAMRAAADWQLEQVFEWGYKHLYPDQVNALREAMLPNSPSLKEQALQALEKSDGADHPVVFTVLTADEHALIRKALEQLDDYMEIESIRHSQIEDDEHDAAPWLNITYDAFKLTSDSQ